jgi:hypothetical protein
MQTTREFGTGKRVKMLDRLHHAIELVSTMLDNRYRKTK